MLADHFPMVADEGRNRAFDRALVASIDRFAEAHGGRKPRVLDIGSGSGLLAMMAARAGATEVHSLEMVPALAAAARHIVAANGYAERVNLHSEMSSRVDAAALGGKFDLLVCEIVDDMLLGEGILSTVTDARRRLLSPSATILPQAGAIWTLAVEIRPVAHDGLRLDDMHTFLCDLALTPEPLATVKLQHLRPGVDYRPLSAPLRLFDFDFANGDLDDLLAKRTTAALPLEMTTDGVLNALLLYFTLDVDGTHRYSSGAESTGSHWEQNTRWLPHELRVRRGQRLSLFASHDDHHVSTLRIANVTTQMLDGMVGHRHVVGLPIMQDAAVALDYATH